MSKKKDHKKIVKFGASPSPAKVPKGEPEDTRTKQIEYSFAWFDNWDWSRKYEPDSSFHLVAHKLRGYESQTWGQVWKDKHYNHFIDRESLCKTARDRLVFLHMDEIDQLFRFRLTGAQRIWGFLQGAVYCVLWWDPDHLVYPYEKKNT